MDPVPERGWEVRPARERLRPEQDELPLGELVQRANHRAGERPLRRPPLEHGQPALLPGTEELEVDAGRDDRVVAGEAFGRGVRRLAARRDEGVDATEQPLALNAAGRVAETLRREKARDGERLGIPQGQVRQARQAGLEAVHDVVAPDREGEREVRAHADRHADPAPPRDRHRRPESNDVGVGAVEKRPPPGEQVGRPARRREDGDVMAELAEPGGDACDVLVHVVRLRPGERRDEAHSKAHLKPSLAPSLLRRTRGARLLWASPARDRLAVGRRTGLP